MVGETIRDRSRARRRRSKLLVAAFLVAGMLTNQGCPAINPATIMMFTSFVSMVSSAVATVAQVAGEEDVASIAGDVARVSGVVNMGASIAKNGSSIFGQGPRVESGAGGEVVPWTNPDTGERVYPAGVPVTDQLHPGTGPGEQQGSISEDLSGAPKAIAYPLPDEPEIERTPLPAPGANEDRFTGVNPFEDGQDYVPIESPPDRWNGVDKEEMANASITPTREEELDPFGGEGDPVDQWDGRTRDDVANESLGNATSEERTAEEERRRRLWVQPCRQVAAQERSDALQALREDPSLEAEETRDEAARIMREYELKVAECDSL